LQGRLDSGQNDDVLCMAREFPFASTYHYQYNTRPAGLCSSVRECTPAGR